MARRFDRRAIFFSPVFGAGEFSASRRTGWKQELGCYAAFTPMRGSESLAAGRLEAQQPGILRVRRGSVTLSIDAGWKVDLDGREMNIRERPTPSADNLFLEMLVQAGVAT